MQAVLRSAGKDTMDKAQYDTFAKAKEEGTLLKPEQPGHVMAKFVASPLKELSGKFFTYVLTRHITSSTNICRWNSPEVSAYQE